MKHHSTSSESSEAAVPVVDISAYFSGSAAEKQRIAEQIDEAWRTVGFLVISGHGVPDDLIERAHRVSRAFYDLPEDAKRKYSTSPEVYRGFHAMGGLSAGFAYDDRMTAPDYREMYTMSREEIDWSDPYYDSEAGRRVFQPNVWPAEVPEFKAVWTEYYKAMDKLAHALMHLFALALKMPEGWFDDKIDKHMTVMAVTNYPDQMAEPTEDQLRCGAHTDYGCLTILKTEDKPGGLEVMAKDGTWRPVPMIPGTFIINLGDLMARWSNDRWVSNLHRVVNPPRDKALGSRRQSLIYFFHPNYDAEIECLPTCEGETGPKYKPTRTREYLLSKIMKLQDV